MRLSRRGPIALLLVALVVVAAVLFGSVARADTDQIDIAPDSPVVVGTAVTFTAKGAICDAPVACSWNVDGTIAAGTGATGSWTAAGAGSHTVNLLIGGVATYSDTLVVQPPPNQAPTGVTVTTSPPGRTSANAGDVVQFTTAATDPDGDPLHYTWRVDGSAVGGAPDSASFNWTAQGGVHQISVAVTDNQIAQPVVSANYQMVVNRPPSVTTPSVSGTLDAGQTLTFSTTGSDPDGNALTYAWAIDGSAAGLSGSGASRTWTATAGPHTVTVTASDGALTSGVGSRAFTVNALPTASISYSPQPFTTGQVVTFDSHASDSDGTIAAQDVDWDLDNDGAFDDASGITATKLFSSPTGPNPNGTYTVRVRVTDAAGATFIASVDVAANNRPPIAVATFSPASPLSTDVVTFDASGSSDPDGTVVSYEWDFDGDGSTDATTSTPTVQHAFTTPGTYPVGLQVTDDKGSTDTLDVPLSVVVTAPLSPPAAITNIAPSLDPPSLAPTGAGATVTPKSTTSKTASKKTTTKKKTTKKAAPKLLSPFPTVRFAGTLTTSGAKLSVFQVKAPKGAKVRIACKPGCSKRKAALTAAAKLRVLGKSTFKSLLGSYRAGRVIEVYVTKGKTIGKYTKITIRKGKAPKRLDRCLNPGSSKPKPCPKKSTSKTASVAQVSRSKP